MDRKGGHQHVNPAIPIDPRRSERQKRKKVGEIPFPLGMIKKQIFLNRVKILTGVQWTKLNFEVFKKN